MRSCLVFQFALNLQNISLSSAWAITPGPPRESKYASLGLSGINYKDKASLYDVTEEHLQ